MVNNKDIEEIKTELTGLKIRLKRIENFLSDFPDISEYISTNSLNNDTGEFLEDDLVGEAEKIVGEYDRASASLLQRRLDIGYARAARLIDILEKKGIIGPAVGSMPRKVLVKN